MMKSKGDWRNLQVQFLTVSCYFGRRKGCKRTIRCNNHICIDTPYNEDGRIICVVSIDRIGLQEIAISTIFTSAIIMPRGIVPLNTARCKKTDGVTLG